MHILYIGNSSMACVHVAIHAVVGWYSCYRAYVRSYTCIEFFYLHSKANSLPYSRTTCLKMAALSTVKLSKYAEQLSVSDKRIYLEKIEEIGDPYSYESSNLQVDLFGHS